eukprot:MONOS_12379.1-p1 / transcript=MONOS_12379.1 / gene=MONOS_12379 / organism=Monocercomonoides_exilis_PA203 / gene_product=U2 small nuclear ribonucleoprotein B'' / transcript_product=U2 small nuclear ribonucleoprotein B'' / location=Mono_scaffold00681:10517-11564(-) / protein_length=251 / sequence_SO=supercontig / SO=protein_coding / is_pseudo=false
MTAPIIAPPLLEPSKTVYANNLNEKIQPDKMKEQLRALFSRFGEIADIICMTSLKRRGQAFIVFTDVSHSTKAIQEMQGALLFGKPVRLNFSKGPSYATLKSQGIDIAPFKELSRLKIMRDRRKERKAEKEGQEEARAKKKQENISSSISGQSKLFGSATPSGIVPMPASVGAPNSILFIQNLPPTRTEEDMQKLFASFLGFKEVRLTDARRDIGFVEFESEADATKALEALQGYPLSEQHKMVVTFAKK